MDVPVRPSLGDNRGDNGGDIPRGDCDRVEGKAPSSKEGSLVVDRGESCGEPMGDSRPEDLGDKRGD